MKKAKRKKAKRQKLKQKGWAVGSAADFLSLSDEEAFFVEIKVMLAMQLKQLRQAEGFTQQQLAETLQTSQSRVAKMEAAENSVSLDLLVKSILALGGTPKDIASAIRSVG